MTMTTTTAFAPKIQKIIDAAKVNGWRVEIVEDTPNYISFKVIHPDPGDYGLAYIHPSFYRSDNSWRFDGANRVETTRDGSTRAAGTMTMRDTIDAIGGSHSPRKRAEKALDEMARVTRRETLMAAYQAETDGPERAQLRRELIAQRDAVASQNKLADETAEHRIEWASEHYLEDALVERHMARLATHVLEWEGMADQNGVHVTTLEEATVRVADGALRGVLGDATRGTSGSTSLFVNVWKDVESVAKAKFVERFHPVYGGFMVKHLMSETFDSKWLGGNSI